jgi:hypothetical protein
MRSHKSMWARSLWSVVGALAAIGLAASNAAAQTAVHLIAAPVTKSVTLPNGSTVAVRMWGYALDKPHDVTVGAVTTTEPPNGILDADEPVTVPGPRLVVPPGNTTLTVTLTNLLPEATSLVIPGQRFDPTPGRNGLRARSMTPEAAPSATAVYTFSGLKAGTFLYQSGSHSAVQVQMGLYGAMTQDSAANVAYAGVAAAGSQPAQAAIGYQNEAVLVYSEIDQALHAAVDAGTYGTPAGPTSTVNYKPSIFLINGESYTNASMATIAAGSVGQVTLLRFLNAGLRTHTPVLDNGSLKIVAEDGNKLPFAKDQATVMLAAGKTHDALWTPATEGVYSLYDRTLGLNAPGQGSAGMLAKLKVGSSALPGSVTAANVNVSGLEDAPSIAGSVASSISAGATPEQLTSPSAGTVAFSALTGAFSYTPSANFFGVDSFTYRARIGADVSAPAMVIITVAAQADAPVATPQHIGVDANGNVNVTLSGTDADGDALKYYLKALPSHGALSYINPASKVETPLTADHLRGGSAEKAIPGGLLIYRPAADYDGPDSFTFVAYDGTSDSAAATISATVYPPDADSPAADLSTAITLLVKGNDGSTISNYRWTLEEDLTYHVVPGIADPNTLAVKFHTSFTPVVASGTDADPIKVNPAKRYYLSVLPTVNNYSNTGGEIEAGVGSLTVIAAKLPLPTARIRVQVFQDNAPLDGMISGTEAGLAGFQVTIDDAGGTYGMSGGHQSTDAMGNKIGTTYQPCADGDGNPTPGACDSYQVAQLGDGFVLSDADGFAVIENLPMGKYTVKVRAPGGDKWIQTTTIEGQPGIDAWVKPNEPRFFTEFGPPGPHVLVGFVKASASIPAGPFRGSGSITGRVTNMRMSRPPDVMQSSGAPYAHTRPWVALNSAATGGELLYTQPVNEDGTFTIANVAAGSYSLVVFDSALDIIIASRAVEVAATGATALGDVPVFAWFANLYSYVYDDLNRNGHHDPGEPGIPDQALNIRFRDGSIYQSATTDDSGFKGFNEVFPFFAWLVAEVDYTRFHSTGLTVVVDNGGTADPANDWQTQAGLPAGLVSPSILNPQPQSENGGKPFREESGAETPFLLLEGFQDFLGQSNVMLWGKAPYEKVGDFVEDVNVAPFDDFPGPGDFDANGDGKFNTDRSNGGIAGIVHYTITRAENDPRWAVAENWEPGVSDVRIQLWDADRKHLLNEAATDNWNNSPPEGCQGAPFFFLGRQTDCYDGLRNFNQARPALFDGGYAFSTILQDDVDHPTYNTPIAERKVARPLPAGKYVVKMIVPPGYKVQKEEDKNVDFGDQYIPQQFWLTGYDLAGGAASSLTTLAAAVGVSQTTLTLSAGGGKSVHPNDVVSIDDEIMRVSTVVGDSLGVIRAQSETTAAAHVTGAEVFSHDAQLAPTVNDNALIAPFCVGSLHTVPNELSLFPGVAGAFGGEQRPLCDAKLVVLREGQQVAPDFHLLTDAPKAGHIYGMVLDDTTNEFDPNAPTFGEKYAPPYMPIAIRDWQGRELAHTYTDQYGMYNALVPSTYTIQVPQPSGVSPSILQACINSPTMAGPNGTVVADPLFQKQYSHFCYPLQYLPGKTTYLDTPVLPTGAFTGTGSFPVDAELPNRTPIVASVNGPLNVGPYIVDTADDATRTIVLTSAGKVDVPNPGYDGPGSAQPKLIKRDYGFGGQGGFVTLGGQRIPYTSWSDTSITVVVPTLAASPSAGQLAMSRTGELAVERCLDGKSGALDNVTGTCNDGRKSVLGVTLNVATVDMHAARPPKVVNAGESIQAKIDAATPGDLILVKPGTYEEMVVMTKPVRLQGAGALSTVINVVTTPSENVQRWLDYTGSLLYAHPDYLLPNQPAATAGPYQSGDVTNVLGDEGAGVTVLGKNLPTLGALGIQTGVCLGGFDSPANEAYCLHNENMGGGVAWLRPNSRIDGLSIIGANNAPGVLANGNNHYLEISNNKIYTNTGTYAGGILLGHPGQLDLQNENAHLQFSSIHNNLVSQNAGMDPNGGAGIVLGTGTGMYRVSENFVAGNFAAGKGAGITHLGNANLQSGTQERPFGLYSYAKPTSWGNTADVPSTDNNISVIDRNTIVFNESFTQGTSTNGGGVFVGGMPPPAGGTTDGSGAVRISNNLIQGNAASGGDGGGVALMGLGGFQVNLYNNIIANNVAGFAGGGISLQDAGSPEIVHNTIVNNDSLAVAGLAFTVAGNPNQSVPQPAGIFVRNATGNVPKITNSIVWHNRSYYFGVLSGGLQIPGQSISRGLIACTTAPCLAGGFRDTGRTGTTAALTMFGTTTSTAATAPAFVKSYVNTDRRNSYQQAEVTTILAPAALDEGGNFIRPQFGPLSLTNLDDTRFSNYHTSAGVNGIALSATVATGGYATAGSVPAALAFDLDREARPIATAADRGADEILTGLIAPPVAVPDIASTGVDTAVVINVLTNDNAATPASGKPLTVTGVSQVVNGSAATDGTTVTFTPNAGFNGQGSVAYAISGVGGEAASTVVVNVGTATPVLSLSPTSMSFGNADKGTASAARQVTVTNTGNALMSIASIALGGTDLDQYTVTGNTCPPTLGGGASCTVTLTFNPTTVGAKLALLNVAVTSPAVSGRVSLSGIGLGTALTTSPTALSFALQTVGQASPAQVVTLTNTGNTFAEFTPSIVTGSPADFSLLLNGCPAGTTPGTRQVVAGGNCTVSVVFTPTGAGSRVSALTLTPTIGDMATVSLSGTGAALSVSTSPASLAFGNVTIATPSAAQAVTITNGGTAPVQLNALTFSGLSAAQFTQTGTCPVAPDTLASSASCVSNVVLKPTAAGAKAANLVVTAIGNPALPLVPLSGTGVAGSITALPATLAYGTVPVSSTSVAQLVTVTNTGTAPVALTIQNIVGANADQFAKTTTCPAILPNTAGSNTCTVSVTLVPTSIGIKTASVTVTPSNGTARVVNMNGVGVVLQATPSALAFGNVTLLTPKTLSVTVTNTGAATIAAPVITFSGANASQFAQTSTCGLLAGGAGCTVNVTFTPTGAAGARTATLSIAGGGETRTVALTGTAVAGAITVTPAGTQPFGIVALNVTSAPRVLTVTNTGSAPVAVSISAITGTSFAKTTTCPAVLPNAASGPNTCTISMTFTPTTTGAKAESFTVAPSSGTVQTVSLTGTGNLPASPTPLAFGNVQNNTSKTLVTTVTNSGTVALTISSVTFSGVNAALYSASVCAGGLVAANGGTCDISVTFTPTTNGSKATTMTLGLAAGAGSQEVAVTGTGATGSIQVNGATSATLAFGNQAIGTSSVAQMITVNNNGTIPVSVSVALAGTNPGQYSQSNSCSAVLAPATTCTVNVVFSPTSIGSKPASVVVTPSSGTPRTTTLSGTGQ